jgi:hypothetical protein
MRNIHLRLFMYMKENIIYIYYCMKMLKMFSNAIHPKTILRFNAEDLNFFLVRRSQSVGKISPSHELWGLKENILIASTAPRLWMPLTFLFLRNSWVSSSYRAFLCVLIFFSFLHCKERLDDRDFFWLEILGKFK